MPCSQRRVLAVKKLKLVAVLPMAAAALFIGVGAANAAVSVTANPASGLSDGQTVTVTMSGAPSGLSDLTFLQCKTKATSQADVIANCNIGHLVPGTASGANYTAQFKVAKADGNYILGASQINTSAIGFATLSFGAAAATTSAAPASSAASDPAAAATTAATTVNTGTGGLLGGGGTPTGVILLGALGAVAVAGGAWRLARR